MDDSVKIILSKLEEIDGRLKKIEGGGSSAKSPQPAPQVRKPEKDPLFSRAVSLMGKYEEIPAPLLQRLLSVDLRRAEKILDQLADAGYGECVWEER